MKHRKPPVRRNAVILAVLLLLLAASVGSAYLRLGVWNSAANLTIAAVKALLVAVFFMHLRDASALVRMTAAVALFMLAVLFGLSATDYRNRADDPAPWQMPRQLSGAQWGQSSW
ncbi:MAG TPA: cytochrome C oxidase subunit IV family protein [Aromatoleum sp.]|uniref:cytochrome C oxidase subunit IV family protein n=1 Tax=Aromatoleum sp. TaxID=2307007 RepID=UPI002B46237F|nr:cytochrome C oxidase subunit IV family protein [Aromatoleum sp.]HJV26916.1 cytochrome C oxidase subunit IV family protein [Aromatoleum sp.]